MTDLNLWQRFLEWRWKRISRAMWKNGYSRLFMQNHLYDICQ